MAIRFEGICTVCLCLCSFMRRLTQIGVTSLQYNYKTTDYCMARNCCLVRQNLQFAL